MACWHAKGRKIVLGLKLRPVGEEKQQNFNWF